MDIFVYGCGVDEEVLFEQCCHDFAITIKTTTQRATIDTRI